jgi:hypothetical protein
MLYPGSGEVDDYLIGFNPTAVKLVGMSATSSQEWLTRVILNNFFSPLVTLMAWKGRKKIYNCY